MNVLVDYYNLPDLLRRRGLQAVVSRIVHSIGAQKLSGTQRIKIKLYGGWYNGTRLTRDANQLLGDVRLYPKTEIVTENVNGNIITDSVIVQVELTRSIEADPRNVLENTYREHGFPEGLICENPMNVRCANAASCSLVKAFHFIDTGRCPDAQCGIRTEEMLRRAEQKLVDSMIIADIIHFANRDDVEICVISSDDDLWPGIKSALVLGRRVIHIQTIQGRTTPRIYSRNAGLNYTQLNLR